MAAGDLNSGPSNHPPGALSAGPQSLLMNNGQPWEFEISKEQLRKIMPSSMSHTWVLAVLQRPMSVTFYVAGILQVVNITRIH